MKETFNYLVFGVLTSLINYISFFVFYDLAFGKTMALAANLISFALASAFAFVTNKAFVFESDDWSRRAIIRQAISFLYHRILSFAIEQVGLLVATWAFTPGVIIFSLGSIKFDGIMVSKIFLSILATILNYFFAKFIVFKKDGSGS